MKKLVKFSILSLFVFASACFVLSSCGNKNGGANSATGGGATNNNNNNGGGNGGGGTPGGNTQINLEGSKYSRTYKQKLQNGQEIEIEESIEFQQGSKFALKAQAQGQSLEMVKGDYNVANKTITAKITWQNDKIFKENIIGQSIVLTLSDDGNKITMPMQNGVLEYTKK